MMFIEQLWKESPVSEVKPEHSVFLFVHFITFKGWQVKARAFIAAVIV